MIEENKQNRKKKLEGSNSPFISAFGVGGPERLVAYPVVLWLIALGGYLIAPSSVALTSPTAKGEVQQK
ncbi:MAG TPA: hypothetical protein VI037_05245 [Nitrososphaera sp.]